jgi:hypothetical protein
MQPRFVNPEYERCRDAHTTLHLIHASLSLVSIIQLHGDPESSGQAKQPGLTGGHGPGRRVLTHFCGHEPRRRIYLPKADTNQGGENRPMNLHIGRPNYFFFLARFLRRELAVIGWSSTFII